MRNIGPNVLLPDGLRGSEGSESCVSCVRKKERAVHCNEHVFTSRRYFTPLTGLTIAPGPTCVRSPARRTPSGTWRRRILTPSRTYHWAAHHPSLGGTPPATRRPSSTAFPGALFAWPSAKGSAWGVDWMVVVTCCCRTRSDKRLVRMGGEHCRRALAKCSDAW